MLKLHTQSMHDELSSHEMRESQTTFADWLTATRKSHGLTQQELADLIQVSKPTVVRMEGGSKPRYNLLGRIALALNVEDVDHVFEIAGYEPPTKKVFTEAVLPEIEKIDLLRSIDEKLGRIEMLLQALIEQRQE